MPPTKEAFCNVCRSDQVLYERWFRFSTNEEVFPGGDTKHPGNSTWCQVCEDFVAPVDYIGAVVWAEDTPTPAEDVDRNVCPGCGGNCLKACA